MPVADFLKEAGRDLAKGAKAVGSVAAPIAERTAQVVSGEAPQIDEEKRQQQYKLEDQQIAAKSQELESQLAIGEKYGTLTPDQRQQYVDQISQLYSHPRHAGTLMEKLRKAVHPGGAVATSAPPLKDAVPAGGTAHADEENAAKLAHTKLMSQPKLAAMENYTQEHFGAAFDQASTDQQLEAMKAVTAASTNKNAHLLINGSVVNGGVDENGKTWTPEQMASGEAGPTLKGQYEAQNKGLEGKRKDALDRLQKAQDFQLKKQATQQKFQAGQNSLNRENQREMAGVRSAQSEYSQLDEAARAKEQQIAALNDIYSLPGDKSAADNAVVAVYATTLTSKGTRIPISELTLARQIGSFGLRMDQMYQKATTGELPPELRKLLLDFATAEAQESRKEAVGALNSDIPMAGGGQSSIPGASVPKKPGGVARALAPVKPPGGVAWKAPPDAPAAPKEDGKVLKSNGQVIAKSKGGQWVQP